MSARAKLRMFNVIVIVLAIAGFIATLIYAPFEGFKGFLFSLGRKGIFVVAAALIITAVIKFKSVTKTDKISKYIMIGVVFYAGLAALAAYIGYGAFKDYKGTKSTINVDYSNYDTFYNSFSKVGSLYYLNINIEGKQHTFCIEEKTYNDIKRVNTIEVKYYPNSSVVYKVNCSGSSRANIE